MLDWVLCAVHLTCMSFINDLVVYHQSRRCDAEVAMKLLNGVCGLIVLIEHTLPWRSHTTSKCDGLCLK